MTLVIKRKYSTDLAGQMAETEANYARIMRLLPDFDKVDHREFAVHLAGDRHVRFRISITERCPYTTMLDLHQLESSHEWAPGPHFSLRVYHDARMAEVVAFHQHRRLRQRYDYPNDKMFQRDEKAQLNQLLGEWLSHCLNHGYEVNSPDVCEPCP